SSFRGTNLTTGHAVPVRLTGHINGAEIGVTLAGRFSKNEVHVQFPTTSGAVYRLDGVGSMTDAYGMHGTFHFTTWSHYLSGRRDSLAAKTFATVARLARTTTDELARVAE